jgi:predicted Fe-S protein YdhL (DUF1289 family)
MTDPPVYDATDLADLDYCNGDGRSVPLSVFRGRVVGPGEPMWLPEDRIAALAWMARERSLCPGCRRPRHETFDIAMDDHYEVTALTCNACAARERKAWNLSAGREPGDPPMFGTFFVVEPEQDQVDEPAEV